MKFLKLYLGRLIGWFLLLYIIFTGGLESQTGKSVVSFIVAMLIFGAYGRWDSKKISSD